MQPSVPPQKTSYQTLRSLNLSKVTSETATYLLLALLFAFFYRTGMHAIQDVGSLFGWMIGASRSAISAATAPLVFGLLATGVLATIARLAATTDAFEVARTMKAVDGYPDSMVKRAVKDSRMRLVVELVAAILILHFITWFVYHTRVGIFEGTKVREANPTVKQPTKETIDPKAT